MINIYLKSNKQISIPMMYNDGGKCTLGYISIARYESCN